MGITNKNYKYKLFDTINNNKITYLKWDRVSLSLISIIDYCNLNADKKILWTQATITFGTIIKKRLKCNNIKYISPIISEKDLLSDAEYLTYDIIVLNGLFFEKYAEPIARLVEKAKFKLIVINMKIDILFNINQKIRDITYIDIFNGENREEYLNECDLYIRYQKLKTIKEKINKLNNS
jgi:hypothetical protein